jgi:hypothetical protein
VLLELALVALELELVVVVLLEPAKEADPEVELLVWVVPVSKMVYLDQIVAVLEMVWHRVKLAVVGKEKVLLA